MLCLSISANKAIYAADTMTQRAQVLSSKELLKHSNKVSSFR